MRMLRQREKVFQANYPGLPDPPIFDISGSRQIQAPTSTPAARPRPPTATRPCPPTTPPRPPASYY